MKKLLVSFAVAGLLSAPFLLGTPNARADESSQAPKSEQIQKQNVQHSQQIAQDDDQNSTNSDN
ncbi:MAG: hypothetical protein QXN16_03540 [Candidatus Micrarchaeaceae archaeon]